MITLRMFSMTQRLACVIAAIAMCYVGGAVARASPPLRPLFIPNELRPDRIASEAPNVRLGANAGQSLRQALSRENVQGFNALNEVAAHVGQIARVEDLPFSYSNEARNLTLVGFQVRSRDFKRMRNGQVVIDFNEVTHDAANVPRCYRGRARDERPGRANGNGNGNASVRNGKRDPPQQVDESVVLCAMKNAANEDVLEGLVIDSTTGLGVRSLQQRGDTPLAATMLDESGFANLPEFVCSGGQAPQSGGQPEKRSASSGLGGVRLSAKAAHELGGEQHKHGHEHEHAAAASPLRRSLHDDVKRVVDEAVNDKRQAMPLQGDVPDGYYYTVEIAVETDAELLAKFGGGPTKTQAENDAASIAMNNYIELVFSIGTIITEHDLGVKLEIKSVSEWIDPATDPYSFNGCSTGLNQLLTYWNANNQNVPRDYTFGAFGTAGTQTCGIAYVGVICNSNFGYGLMKRFGPGYGEIDANDPLQTVWDLQAFLHEVGHSLNSPHTFDYCNIDGNPDPIDRSWSGCQGSRITDIVQATAGGIEPCPGPGQYCATIMSYAHMAAGGYANTALSFGGSIKPNGTEHLYGKEPLRVSERIQAHMDSRTCVGNTSPPSPTPPPTSGSTSAPTAFPTAATAPPTAFPTAATAPPTQFPTAATSFPTPPPTSPPTAFPTAATAPPTQFPTAATSFPTPPPTSPPTAFPTAATAPPTAFPTAATAPPTPFPTAATSFPTPPPTSPPTAFPTAATAPPTQFPTAAGSPTRFPTQAPTPFPTPQPTAVPSSSPTPSTAEPTRFPTPPPTTPPPTRFPTLFPTTFPTTFPTAFPTSFPTNQPTMSPTSSPTMPQTTTTTTSTTSSTLNDDSSTHSQGNDNADSPGATDDEPVVQVSLAAVDENADEPFYAIFTEHGAVGWAALVGAGVLALCCVCCFFACCMLNLAASARTRQRVRQSPLGFMVLRNRNAPPVDSMAVGGGGARRRQAPARYSGVISANTARSSSIFNDSDLSSSRERRHSSRRSHMYGAGAGFNLWANEANAHTRKMPRGNSNASDGGGGGGGGSGLGRNVGYYGSNDSGRVRAGSRQSRSRTSSRSTLVMHQSGAGGGSAGGDVAPYNKNNNNVSQAMAMRAPMPPSLVGGNRVEYSALPERAAPAGAAGGGFMQRGPAAPAVAPRRAPPPTPAARGPPPQAPGRPAVAAMPPQAANAGVGRGGFGAGRGRGQANWRGGARGGVRGGARGGRGRGFA